MSGPSRKVKPGLKRISSLLRYLGNPQNCYLSIQVAGTNGKGSTSHFLHNILGEAGIKVGLYTSPHIIEPEERVIVSGEEYKGTLLEDARALGKSYVRARGKTTGDSPTYFELTTAIALDYFREKGINFAVLETGLGGALDATSVVSSVGGILTDISLDHQEFLGNSLEGILMEKLVVARGRFLISSILPQYFRRLAEAVCAMRGGRALFMGKDFFYEKTGKGTFNFAGGRGHMTNMMVSSDGEFQMRNASLAIEASFYLQDILAIDTITHSSSARKGVAKTFMGGRFQKVTAKPDVVIDVGHNVLSAQVIRRELLGMKNNGTGNVVCIFTMMSKRNPEPFLMTLKDVVDLFILFPCGRRYLDPREMKYLSGNSFVPLKIVPDFHSAMTGAREEAGQCGVILLTGSFAVAELYHRHMNPT